MNEHPIPTFQFAIQSQYATRSELRERIRVVEKFQGQTVWEGDVLVFDLSDHPTAKRCYAWLVDDRTTAVLGEPPINSA